METGEVDARWLFGGCFEFNRWPDYPSEPGDWGEKEGKEVGEWSILVDPSDPQILHFTLSNVYPSYAVDCEVHFRMEGSIPVIVRGEAVSPGPGLTQCTFDGTKLACNELTVIFTDNLDRQLHPGREYASSVVVHVEQPAEQLAEYSFDIGICLAQWNEDATAQECFDHAPAH